MVVYVVKDAVLTVMVVVFLILAVVVIFEMMAVNEKCKLFYLQLN